MVPSGKALLPARQGVLPVFRRLPLGGLLLWVLTAHASAAMLCLAFVTFAHGLPLGVWPSLAALVFNVVGNALLTLFNQKRHRGGDSTDLARLLYRPALVVGVLGWPWPSLRPCRSSCPRPEPGRGRGRLVEAGRSLLCSVEVASHAAAARAPGSWHGAFVQGQDVRRLAPTG